MNVIADALKNLEPPIAANNADHMTMMHQPSNAHRNRFYILCLWVVVIALAALFTLTLLGESEKFEASVEKPLVLEPESQSENIDTVVVSTDKMPAASVSAVAPKNDSDTQTSHTTNFGLELDYRLPFSNAQAPDARHDRRSEPSHVADKMKNRAAPLNARERVLPRTMSQQAQRPVKSGKSNETVAPNSMRLAAKPNQYASEGAPKVAKKPTPATFVITPTTSSLIGEARMLEKKGELSAAIKLLEYHAIGSNTSLRLLQELGRLHYSTGDYIASIKFYQKVVSEDKDNVSATLGIAVAYEALGITNRATAYYQRIVSKLGNRHPFGKFALDRLAHLEN